MIEFFKNKLKKWCLANYPLKITTEIQYKILVKKGKIREWRFYDQNHVRIKDIELTK